MKKSKKLQILIEKSEAVKTKNSTDPIFHEWRTYVERSLARIFGDKSIEVREFNKLKFHDPRFEYALKMMNASQNVQAFDRDFETALKLIKQYTEEALIDEENNSKPTDKLLINEVTEFPKFHWLGTQKQLGELFIELKNKGWIDKIDKDLITLYFTNAKTIAEVLKPAVDKGGEPTYEKIFTKAYKRSFNNIAINDKK